MAINSRYPTLATVSHMTTGNKHYAVAEGDTCLLRVPVRAMMSSFELLVNLFGIAVWLRVIALSNFQGSSHYPTPTGPGPLPKYGTINARTIRDLFIGLYYAY